MDPEPYSENEQLVDPHLSENENHEQPEECREHIPILSEDQDVPASSSTSSSDETVCNTHFESSDSEFEDPIVEQGIDVH